MRTDGRFRRWGSWALALGLAGILAGCLNPIYRPQRTRYTYGLTMTEPAKTDANSYEDESLYISFQFFQTQIGFHILNNTRRPLTIYWDKSRYLSETGTAKRVFHKGVPVRNRNKPQRPTVIPAKTSIDEHVIPIENVLQGFLPRSKVQPIFPVWDYEDRFYSERGRQAADRAATRRRATAASLEGRTVGVDLAMEVNGSQKTYRFRFLVKVSRQ
ncbi:MAG: hypothetical protein ACE5JS_10375 [Nitrospinota bacterium]